MSGPFLCTCGLFNLQRVCLLSKASPFTRCSQEDQRPVEGLIPIFSLSLTLSGWGSGSHHPLPSGPKATGLWKRNSVLQAYQQICVGSSGLGLYIQGLRVLWTASQWTKAALGQTFPLVPDSSCILAAKGTSRDQRMGRWSTRPASSLGTALEATEIVSSGKSFSLSLLSTSLSFSRCEVHCLMLPSILSIFSCLERDLSAFAQGQVWL